MSQIKLILEYHYHKLSGTMSLRYNSRADRYATKKTKVIEIDESCWEDMIDLAENYHRQCCRKDISFADAQFGDRRIIRYCQLWHDVEAPGEFLIRLRN